MNLPWSVGYAVITLATVAIFGHGLRTLSQAAALSAALMQEISFPIIEAVRVSTPE
jgi:hypothetical protein